MTTATKTKTPTVKLRRGKDEYGRTMYRFGPTKHLREVEISGNSHHGYTIFEPAEDQPVPGRRFGRSLGRNYDTRTLADVKRYLASYDDQKDAEIAAVHEERRKAEEAARARRAREIAYRGEFLNYSPIGRKYKVGDRLHADFGRLDKVNDIGETIDLIRTGESRCHRCEVRATINMTPAEFDHFADTMAHFRDIYQPGAKGHTLAGIILDDDEDAAKYERFSRRHRVRRRW